jgi:two-component system response regulator YesN
MYKVFFVEDEIIVRRGVKNNIAWENTNFELVGDAPDGEEALPKILELKPDIVITDIKMPFMDGLELSRRLKKEMPWIRIVILSGHDEFKYAKEALSIGVKEYMLKPFKGSELIAVLDRIAAEIVLDEERNMIDGKFPFSMEEFIKALSPQVILKCENLLIEYLKFGNASKVEEFIDNYLSEITNGDRITSSYYNFILINFITNINKFFEEININMDQIIPKINEIEKITGKLNSFEDLAGSIKAIVISAMEFRDIKRRDKYSYIIEQIKEYVKQNYKDPAISLNTAAAIVNISPNHLSAVFSKETGVTFIEFLNKVRLNKAKELLKTTNLRSSEIAYQVGYSDPHYFSHTFKKNEKCTPNEYRAN